MLRWSAGLLGWFAAVSMASGEVAWKPSIEIATGKAVRGPWQQNDSRYDYVDDPTVAIDERGAVSVAWVDQGRKDIFFQRFGADGARLAEPTKVSGNPATFSWLPRIALAPGSRERIFILWQEIIFSGGSHGGDILFARSQDGGTSFSAPVNLSSSVAGDGKGRIRKDVWHNGSLDIAAGPEGALYAAWTEYEGALWIAASRDGGTRFSPPSRIPEPGPARAPALAVAVDGAVYLAWTVGEDDSADIRVAKSTDGAMSFSEPSTVERSKAYSDAPKIVVDRGGTVHLAWAESSGGPFDRYHVRYTRSSDGGESFSPSMAISSVNASFPSLALDTRGAVYVVWELFHEHRHRPRGLGYAFSRDAGRSFTAPAFVPESADRPGHWNGSQQGLLMRKLAVNSGGAIAIVNSSLRESDSSRVWLIRGQGPK